MSKKNIIIIDEKQIMAGSFSRYLKYRLGSTVTISSVTTIQDCERQMNGRTQVIVLEYIIDDNYDPNRGAHIKNTIKGFDADMDVILLTSDNDVRTDIVKSIKEMERQANRHIRENSKRPLTMIATTLNNAFIYPIRVFVAEHTVSAFIGLFSIAFAVIGLAVIVAQFTFR
jgi:hypothetical protein